MTARPRDRRRRAFTLIEVTVALAIFAMAATVLVGSFANALLARERSLVKDVQAADIQMVRRQLLLEPNRDNAEDGGDVDTLSSGSATWECEIEETEIVDLFRVGLRIRFDEIDTVSGQAAEHLETLYLLRPTWSKSDIRSDLLEDKRDALQDRRDFGF